MLRSLLLLLLLAAPLRAENVALVLSQTGSSADVGFVHDELAASYSAAGFKVTGGLDLDREGVLEQIAATEALLSGPGHLVIHFSGGVQSVSGLLMFVPADATGDSSAAMLAEALPIAIFQQLAAAREGTAVMAFGNDDAPLPPIESDSVFFIDGPTQAVADMITVRLLGDGLAPSQINPSVAGVRFFGLVSDTYRLGRAGSVAAAQATPASAEAALTLGLREQAAIQEGLALLGFNPGNADGTFGPDTRDALRAWASAAGQEPTGYLNADSLIALNADIDAARAAQVAELAEREAWSAAISSDSIGAYRAFLDSYPQSRFAERALDRLDTLEASAEAAQRVAGYRDLELSLGLTLESVATLEARLAALGFTPGPADGRVEIETRRSIAQFQAQAGLTPTGYLNPATIQRILISRR